MKFVAHHNNPLTSEVVYEGETLAQLIAVFPLTSVSMLGKLRGELQAHQERAEEYAAYLNEHVYIPSEVIR